MFKCCLIRLTFIQPAQLESMYVQYCPEEMLYIIGSAKADRSSKWLPERSGCRKQVALLACRGQESSPRRRRAQWKVGGWGLAEVGAIPRRPAEAGTVS